MFVAIEGIIYRMSQHLGEGDFGRKILPNCSEINTEPGSMLCD